MVYLSSAVYVFWVALFTGHQGNVGQALHWVSQGQQNLALLTKHRTDACQMHMFVSSKGLSKLLMLSEKLIYFFA